MAEVQLGKMLQPAAASQKDFPTPYLKAGSLSAVETLGEEFATMFATESDVQRYEVTTGDLVVVEGGDVGRAEFLPTIPSGVIIQNSLHRIRPREGTDVRFLKYCLDAVYASGWLEVVCNKATFGHLTREKLCALPVPRPQLRVQRAIADYLDAETARLDALIEKKRRMIELLEERRSVWVNDVVRRGLVSLQLKDSGLDWLGDVPSHWQIRRNRTLFRETDERSVTGSEEMLSVSHLTGVTPRSEKDVNMFLAESNVGYKVCHPGDLAINTMWAYMGALGVARHHGIVSPSYNVYRSITQELSPDYFDLLCRTPAYVTQINRFSKGVWTSRLRLYPDAFLDLRTPLPPPAEQVELVRAVMKRDSEIHPLRERLQRATDLLIEHRQAFITAAVTGELAIPGVAA